MNLSNFTVKAAEVIQQAQQIHSIILIVILKLNIY